jgi:hypothetical protein
MLTVVFTSETVYYAGGADIDFSTLKTPSEHTLNGGKF